MAVAVLPAGGRCPVRDGRAAWAPVISPARR